MDAGRVHRREEHRRAGLGGTRVPIEGRHRTGCRGQGGEERDQPVVGLIRDKLPVSISLGLWTTLLVYLISIPLGVAKAVRDGSRFDVVSSSVVIIGNAIPGFLFALLLVVLFAGGSYVKWFPLRGLVSDDWSSFSLAHKIADYLWHMVLPIGAMVIVSPIWMFASCVRQTCWPLLASTAIVAPSSVLKMIFPSEKMAPRFTVSQHATPCEAAAGLGLNTHLAGAPGFVRSSA